VDSASLDRFYDEAIDKEKVLNTKSGGGALQIPDSCLSSCVTSQHQLGNAP